MSQLNVTSTRALQVYWSLLWRFVLYSLIPMAILGAVAYRVDQEGMLAGVDMAEATFPGVVLLAGLALTLLVPVFIVRRVLGLSYSGFSIVLNSPSPRFKIEPQLRGTPKAATRLPAQPPRKPTSSGPTSSGRRRIEPSFVS